MKAIERETSGRLDTERETLWTETQGIDWTSAPLPAEQNTY